MAPPELFLSFLAEWGERLEETGRAEGIGLPVEREAGVGIVVLKGSGERSRDVAKEAVEDMPKCVCWRFGWHEDGRKVEACGG